MKRNAVTSGAAEGLKALLLRRARIERRAGREVARRVLEPPPEKKSFPEIPPRP